MRIQRETKTQSVTETARTELRAPRQTRRADSFGRDGRSAFVAQQAQQGGGVKPWQIGGVVAPELEQQLRDRIGELNHVLLAGLVTPELEASIRDEIRRLERVLLAGAAAGIAGLVSPELEQQIRDRIRDIDRLFMIALLSEEGAAQLEAEKAALQRLLQVA